MKAGWTKIELSGEDQKILDERVEEITEDDELTEKQKRFARWTGKEAVVGSTDRLRQVAADIVSHFEQRLSAAEGKGMIVCMSRRSVLHCTKKLSNYVLNGTARRMTKVRSRS